MNEKNDWPWASNRERDAKRRENRHARIAREKVNTQLTPKERAKQDETQELEVVPWTHPKNA